MLNLPTAPNLLLLPGEPITAASLVMPITPVSDQLTEQNFGNILAETVENSLDKEENAENSLSIFPAEALFVASTTTTEITGNGSLTMMLSVLAGNATSDTDTDQLTAENYNGPLTHFPDDSLPAATKEITQQPSNLLLSRQLQTTRPYIMALSFLAGNATPNTDTDQHSAESYDGSLTHFSGDSLPVATKKITQQPSNSLLSSQLQTIRPYHTNSILNTLNENKGAAAISVSEYGQNQAAIQAIFSDSGKIQPLLITPPPSMHMGNALAATTPSTPPPDSASVPLTTTLGSPAWPDEFGQKITWIATQRLQSAELRLHPAHLGPIEIMLQLSGEQGAQKLSAQFSSHHSVVREAIEANLPRLREIMAESGIELMDTSVSADTSRQHAESGQRETPSRQAVGNGSNGSLNQHETQLIVRHEGVINTFA